MSIDPISAPIGISSDILWRAESATKDKEGAFKSILADSIRQVQGYGESASATVANLLAGSGEDLHDVAIASQKAELSFELFLQTRNKVVSAYQEVMRMQI